MTEHPSTSPVERPCAEYAPTLGSLCSGVGGLEMGVERAIGARTMWQAEVNPDASAVLAVRWPDVPNLGDLTAVEWETVPPVDILVGGFPCQPVSAAGARKGVDDERWLFDAICDAVGRMGARPRLCLFENVAGLLSANDGNAMARVVHGLAALGYVGRYGVLRASDVGACHGRARVFLLAADAEHDGRHGAALGRSPRQGEAERWMLQPQGHRAEDAAHAERVGGEGVGTPRHEPVGSHAEVEDAPDAQPSGLQGRTLASVGGSSEPAASGTAGWGGYEPAVRRHERVLGRPAPPALDDGRLSPRFVEWMMMFPEGWVTDVLDRVPALKALGNAVVPSVSEQACRILLAAEEVAA